MKYLGVGPVRAVQPGGGPGRSGGSYQQETVAGDYQGFRFTLIHNLRSLHTQNTVSLFLMKRTVFHFFHCRIFLKRTVFIFFTMKNLGTNWNLISSETH